MLVRQTQQTTGEPPVNGGGTGVPPPIFSTLHLTEDQFRAFLQTLASQTGSMAELARRLDLTGQFVGEVIAGRKHPGPKLLNKSARK